jgi:hypothetical protein
MEKMEMWEVIEANKRAGFHFFDADTKRFFRSRIGNTLYVDRYFTTSEQFHNNMTGQTDARKYTIREFHKDTGRISEVGEFQQYDSNAQAVRAVKKMLNGV